MRFADVKEFLGTTLSSYGYGDGIGPAMPLIEPGPADDKIVQKLSPGAMVFLAIGDGRGFTTEQVFDSPFIRVRVVGPPAGPGSKDYASGETLAYDVDRALCSVAGNTYVGSALTLYINRAGGAPALLLKDVGDRYHFTCTYITETEYFA